MQEYQMKWARIVAHTWVDEGFKNRLFADPKAVLKENGIDFPENVKVNISEDRST
jgi:hypothetical protein